MTLPFSFAQFASLQAQTEANTYDMVKNCTEPQALAAVMIRICTVSYGSSYPKAVSGVMVFVKYHTSSHIFTELYDEASERWFELPHEMPPQLGMGSLVLVPTAALVRTLALAPSSGDGVRENE